MKTQELYKCIDFIIKTQVSAYFNYRIIFELNGGDYYSYFEPVRRELHENLILLDRREKTELIRFYVNEIYRSVDCDYFENLKNDPHADNYDFLEKDVNNPPQIAKQGLIFHEFYKLRLNLFEELQSVCEDNNISFSKILKEEYIDINTIFYYFELYEENEIDDQTKPDEIPIKEKDFGNQFQIPIKPVFKPGAIPVIFEILKDFFKPEHQAQFMDLLIAGSIPNEKLLFRDNSNRLTDTFKKLIEHDFITGCSKKTLQEWICQSFMFLQKNVAKPYNIETVERTISGNQNPCMNPLIQIINGQIVNDPHPRQNKTRNH